MPWTHIQFISSLTYLEDIVAMQLVVDRQSRKIQQIDRDIGREDRQRRQIERLIEQIDRADRYRDISNERQIQQIDTVNKIELDREDRKSRQIESEIEQMDEVN